MTGEGGDVDPGENQEAGIVRDQVQMAGAGGRVPADEAITGSGLPGCGTEEHTRQVASMLVTDRVGEVLADRASVAQIMVSGEVAGKSGSYGKHGSSPTASPF